MNASSFVTFYSSITYIANKPSTKNLSSSSIYNAENTSIILLLFIVQLDLSHLIVSYKNYLLHKVRSTDNAHNLSIVKI